MNFKEALKRKIPICGFSSWHHLVAHALPGSQGHNAVIIFEGESVVIYGEPFNDTGMEDEAAINKVVKT